MLRTIGLILAALAIFALLTGGIVWGAKSLTVSVSRAEQSACHAKALAEHTGPSNCPETETVWDRTKADPVAFYTFWLTLFTLALALGAAIQSGLIARQISLARDEFKAAYPPDLAVREAKLTYIERDNSPVTAIQFILINRGRSPATIIESVFRRTEDWTEVPESHGVNEIGILRLAPGEFRKTNVPLLGDAGEIIIPATDMGMFAKQIFHGAIVYRDDAGHRRRMVFKRECAVDTGRGFLATGNPEDEYTD